MGDWTEAAVGDQGGCTALITGANSGIGWDAARVLAEHGAEVVLACRNVQKGKEARDRILALHPKSQVSVLSLDLGDLESVKGAADEFQRHHETLDLLINNAGLMVTPEGRTRQGFETQFGVNHLGHFALTGHLLKSLLSTPGSRVVTVSSGGHRMGTIRFDDLHWERGYKPGGAYGQSKLANLLFTYELQRRFEASGAVTSALAAHPGAAATNLANENPGGLAFGLFFLLRPLIERLVTQSSAMGALPTLRAAVDPAARGGEYYGPGGFAEQRGYPVRVDSNDRSKDEPVARRLWEVSEELTGISYPFAS